MSVSDQWSPPPVGGYHFVRWLGRGGFGSVYLGQHKSGQRAAVKLLHWDLVEDLEVRRRFRGEIAQLQHVQGPDVVGIIAADADGPVPWIATEFVDGPTLQKAVRTEGPRSGADLYRLASRTSHALAVIHSRGVIHRDFKPANILLPPEGPRVIDFGISRFLEATSVTPSGLLGTRGYAAPEQLQNAPLSTAVDVFAWGCVMVFAATGRSPFSAGNGEAWREQVLHGSPETGATREPLLKIVMDCLHRDPAQRPIARDLMDRLVETHSAGWYDTSAAEASPTKGQDVPPTLRLTSTGPAPPHQ